MVERDELAARLKSAQADSETIKKEIVQLTAKAQEHMSDIVSLCCLEALRALSYAHAIVRLFRLTLRFHCLRAIKNWIRCV